MCFSFFLFTASALQAVARCAHMGITQVLSCLRAGLQTRAMFRTAVMMAASLALTGAVVAHAYYLKHQFYPTVVYLTKSSPSMAVS